MLTAAANNDLKFTGDHDHAYIWAYGKGGIWHWAFNDYALILKKKRV